MERLLKSRYKIGEKLSENPFSVTYTGSYLGTNKPVIIKIYKRGTLNSTLIKTMKQKVKDFGFISHHAVAKLLDGDYGWQGFYYVREFIEGRNLKEIMAGAEKLDLEKALALAGEIAQALEFVHNKGLIHGALTPSNIFITSQGVVKLADFVIEGEIKEALPQKPLLIMQDGCYISPEELAGQPAQISSDIFALGLILYELVTKAQPFSQSGLTAALKKLKGSGFINQQAIMSLPKYLQDIINKALQFDPLLRFATAEDFRLSLENHGLRLQARPAEDFVDIFDSTVAQYGSSALLPEAEALEEIGQIKLRWSKEKHRNIILALLLAAAVSSGFLYAFLFAR